MKRLGSIYDHRSRDPVKSFRFPWISLLERLLEVLIRRQRSVPDFSLFRHSQLSEILVNLQFKALILKSLHSLSPILEHIPLSSLVKRFPHFRFEERRCLPSSLEIFIPVWSFVSCIISINYRTLHYPFPLLPFLSLFLIFFRFIPVVLLQLFFNWVALSYTAILSHKFNIPFFRFHSINHFLVDIPRHLLPRLFIFNSKCLNPCDI